VIPPDDGRPRMIADDVRTSGLCIEGFIGFCKEHELDYRAVLREGYPIDDLAKFNNGFADLVADCARTRLAKEQQHGQR
jgi:hypothetical protein